MSQPPTGQPSWLPPAPPTYPKTPSGGPGPGPPIQPRSAPTPAYGPPIPQVSAPAPAPVLGRTVSVQAIAPVVLWRLAVAGAALLGVYEVLGNLYGSGLAFNWDGLYELSQLGSFVAGFVYLILALWPLATGGRSLEPPTAWPRGAMAVMMLLISVTSIALLDPQLSNHGFLFEHLITPVLIVLDFVFVGRAQFRTRWWEPLSWLVLPLAYFGFLAATGFQSYSSIFDPSDSLFWAIVLGFIAAVAVFGYVLFGLTRLLRPVLDRD